MTLHKCSLLLASLLVAGESYCDANETQPETTQAESASSSANEDQGPSIAEVVAEIANDPGAGFGGGR